MTGIKVHGHSRCIATRRVLIALYEKNLDFEHVRMDFQNEKNPFMFFDPYARFLKSFQDGDVELIDSRKITQYIANQYSDKGNNLISIGEDIESLAKAIEIESAEFDPAASLLAWERIFKPLLDGDAIVDLTVVKELEVNLAAALDDFESRLSQTKYLASNHFTLVDLHTIPVIQDLLKTPTKRLFDERTHVKAWVEDITSRPSSQKSAFGFVALEGDDGPVSGGDILLSLV